MASIGYSDNNDHNDSDTGEYLAILDYCYNQAGDVLFHSVEYSRDGERTGKRTFIVKTIPFLMQVGPFKTGAIARTFMGRIASLMSSCEIDPAETVEMGFKMHKASDDSQWKGLPAAYLPNLFHPSEFWAELTINYKGTCQFYKYSDYYTELEKTVKKELETVPEEGMADYRGASIFNTDRTLQDSIIRVLSSYSIPGVFKRTKTDTMDDDTTAENSRVETIEWAEFKSMVLDNQTIEDATSLTLDKKVDQLMKDEEEKNQQEEMDEPAPQREYKGVEILVGVINSPFQQLGKLIEFYKVDLCHSRVTKQTKLSSSTYDYSKTEIETLEKKGLVPDIMILGLGRDIMDNIKSQLIPPGARRYDLSTYPARILSTMAKNKNWNSLPYNKLRNSNFPIIITQECEKLKSPTGLFSMLSNICTKSRITGRNLSFSSNPLDIASLSRRAEGIIARCLFQAGFKVLPSPPPNFGKDKKPKAFAHVSKDKKTTGSEDDHEEGDDISEKQLKAILENINLKGGVNGEVNAQFVCSPNIVINIDFNSFYGAIICAFKLDPCNTATWTMLETEMRKMIKSDPGPSVTPGSYSQTHKLFTNVDISPVANEWRKEVSGGYKESAAVRDANDLATVGKGSAKVLADKSPVMSFIKKCLLMRRALQRSISQIKEVTPDADVESIVSMAAFLKGIVSATYGAIAYINNRFYHLPFAAMVTHYGRTIIQESSEFFRSKMPRNGKEIMCVTDSLAYRFEESEYSRMMNNVREFMEMINHRYGSVFQITVERMLSLLLAKRNNYMFVPYNKQNELVVKGFSPKHKSTPKYITTAMNCILLHFMKDYKRNIWTGGDENLFISSLHLEEFVLVLKRSVGHAFQKNLLHSDPIEIGADAMKNWQSNSKWRDLFVNFGSEDAKRKNFLYHTADAKTNPFIKIHTTLGFVHGPVVEYDEKRGCIISPAREITKGAWEFYYLDFIRKGIIGIVEELFPPIAADRAICDIILNLNPLSEWSGRSILNPNGVKANASLLKPKVSKNFWDRITKLAYTEEMEDEETGDIISVNPAYQVEFVTKERLDLERGDLGPEPPKAPPPPPISTNGDQSSDSPDSPNGGEAWSVLEDEMLDILNAIDPDSAVQALPEKEAKKKKKKKPTTKKPKPVKRVRVVSEITEYIWSFQTVCRSCNKANSTRMISVSTTYNCVNCGESVFGDFMDLDKAMKEEEDEDVTKANRTKLICYKKVGETLFDYNDPERSFTELRYNWKSLNALAKKLIFICTCENAASSVVVPSIGAASAASMARDLSNVTRDLNANDGDSLIYAQRSNQERLLFVNFAGLGDLPSEQRTINREYLALAYQALCKHPYRKFIAL